VSRAPLDALPDLSDVQVIIRTTFPGQAPQIVESQVTYPLTTTMMSVPGAKHVRGYSFFGDSFVYVLFEDGTDPYWARSRVLEYLSQVQGRLPRDAKPALGPDATGVGWIYQYALVDKSGRHDLAELRAIQDWFLKYELKTVPNVAEVATVGGMVRQYQIVLDPDRLRAFRIPHSRVIEAIQKANMETGGSVIELAEAEYMVRASGYLRSLDDFRKIPVFTSEAGVPVRLADVARIQVGPEARRGIAEFDGQGEAVGGLIVMRSGKNALSTIEAVKAKLASLAAGLPPGVSVVTVYDRSTLIRSAVTNLAEKLVEEFVVVAIVCLVFLFHLRSAFVAIVSLPVGVLAAFIVMHYQGVNANVMSLAGIAIAIGAMVDAAVVMIENAHKHLEQWRHAHGGAAPEGADQWRVIADAATEVGPALFFCLLIITLSFIPVFMLEAQEGRLFAPLAFTKTYAMAAAAGLAVTLVPVLMGYLVRGRTPDEARNPLNRWLIAAYRPLLDVALRFPVATVVVAVALAAATAIPAMRLGGEFLPPLDEGDLLYMPSALPGLGAGKAAEILQQTDALIKSVPEVATVFGKVGRAETATDPAPLEMFETMIQLKPKSEWRPGMTMDKLVAELDRTVQVPGLSNLWVPPIRNRIDMLATGIKSPVGIKVSGPDLAEIDRIGTEIERVVKPVPGVGSALAERLTGGRYLDIEIDRDRAARYGLNIADVQQVVASAIGGDNVGETVEGLRRFPINVRYPRSTAIRWSVCASCRSRPSAGADPPGRRGRPAHHRRRADAEKRECAPVGLGLRRPPRPRPQVGGARDAVGGGAEGEAAARLLRVVVRSVRVSGTRRRASAGRGSVHPDDRVRPPVLHLPACRRGVADHGRDAVRAGRRHLAPVAAGPQRIGGERGRLHRAGRGGGGVRRDHAPLPATRVGGEARARARHPRRSRGGDTRGCRAARAPEGDDRGRDLRRAAADHAVARRGLGGDAADRGADGRRHGHRAAAVDVRDSRGLPAGAAAPLARAAPGRACTGRDPGNVRRGRPETRSPIDKRERESCCGPVPCESRCPYVSPARRRA
jgi:Cu(I)/Ag(I) efflux system membrane protein CusA/SilA